MDAGSEDWTEKIRYSWGVDLGNVVYLRRGQSGGGPKSNPKALNYETAVNLEGLSFRKRFGFESAFVLIWIYFDLKVLSVSPYKGGGRWSLFIQLAIQVSEGAAHKKNGHYKICHLANYRSCIALCSRFWLFSMWLRIPLENISDHTKLLIKLLLIGAAILLAFAVQC